MKLKFKEQQYQSDAVDNTIRVFSGQPNHGLAEYVIDKGKSYIIQNGKKIPMQNLDFDPVIFQIGYLQSKVGSQANHLEKEQISLSLIKL